ncbi:MAG: N-acetyltransferase [Pseudonocardiales bacterium]|nr:N-acetyltransferase [Pseudonocardiales bacterium]
MASPSVTSPSPSSPTPSPASPTQASAAPDPARWFSLERLTGDLVDLVPLAYEHAEGYFAAVHAADGADGAADVFRWLSLAVPRTVDDARRQIALALTARASGERLPYAQLDATTGEFIGTTSLYEVYPELRTLAIGHTWLGRPWWRTGHNTDSKLLLLGHAFESLGAVRVVWHTDIRNERSQAAIERLGAVREGVLRKHRIRRDGSWRDTVQYAMTDDDWPAAHAVLTSASRRA